MGHTNTKEQHQRPEEASSKNGPPPKVRLNHDALGRVGHILARQYPDKRERHKLVNFAQDILKGVDPAYLSISAGDLKFVHTVLDALPGGAELEAERRAVVLALEKDGLDMSMTDSAKDTPLLRAIKTGNRGALDALLHTTGCDINATDKYSSTCLTYAVQQSDVDTVQTILRRFARTVNLDKTDYANYTALAYAASSNSLELCMLLLNAGARVDVNSVSPLFLAVSNNASQALVKLLISHGASVNVSSSNGMNALAAAAKNKRTDTVSLLLDKGANCPPDWFRNSAFMTALSNDHLEMLMMFLKHGVDLRGRDPKGASIIHACCVHGSDKVLQYVISAVDVDLDCRNRLRQTAAHVAALYNSQPCLLTLFRAGADCWSLDPRGHTGLEIALFHNRCECVRFFVEHPVFPVQKLFSTWNQLQNEYDKAALNRKPAFRLFEQLLLTYTGQGDQVDTLFNSCVICIRRILGRKYATGVTRLPLPEKVKNKLLCLE